MEKLLRTALLILGSIMAITGIIGLIGGVEVMLASDGLLKTMGTKALFAFLNLFQPLAISALCFFAAHMISPLRGRKND